MDKLTVLPEKEITAAGQISKQFLNLGINRFQAACDHMHHLPYGYNSDRDDLMIVFKEKMGTCATKHAVVATLAEELGLGVTKTIGIYALTEEIVAGADAVLTHFGLPYVPMVHCFLVHGSHRVDLTAGNRNGKKRVVDDFLFTAPVTPAISAKQEYLLYRRALQKNIMLREEMQSFDLKQVLQARESSLALLKRHVSN